MKVQINKGEIYCIRCNKSKKYIDEENKKTGVIDGCFSDNTKADEMHIYSVAIFNVSKI